MADKLNAKKVSLSLASVSGIFSIVCAALIAIAPQATTSLFGTIFHGINISQIASPITLWGAVVGTVEVIIMSLIAGWLFARAYNSINE